jgi:hypothetical protein
MLLISVALLAVGLVLVVEAEQAKRKTHGSTGARRLAFGVASMALGGGGAIVCCFAELFGGLATV